MDNNEYIEQMRKNSNIVTQVAKIPSIERDRKYKEEIEKYKKNNNKTDFKPIMDKANELVKEKGTLEQQKAYIASRQFIEDFHLEEIGEELTRKK